MNNYQVLITPLTAPNVYGKEVDVSEFVPDVGINGITREVDDGDYDVGIFTYGAVTLTGLNSKGKFNGPEDWRSIFQHSRDLAKVKINFIDENSNSSTVFEGLTHDDGVEINVPDARVEMEVLSKDSIIRKTTVSAGAIVDGTTLSSALKLVLNTPKITSVLTYSPGNINVGVDLAIDDASVFDEVPSKDAIDLLLVASNSILYVDSTGTIIVRSRSLAGTSPDLTLYKGDRLGRDNIASIDNYNPGLHRMFNAVKVNGTIAKNEDYQTDYEVRQKDFTFAFITDTTKEAIIAAAILDELKAPKAELELTTDIVSATGLEIYDQAQVIAKTRYKATTGKLPIYDTGLIYNTGLVYPFEDVSLKLVESVGYKIIGIMEDPASLKTTLKLRQFGITVSDGNY